MTMKREGRDQADERSVPGPGNESKAEAKARLRREAMALGCSQLRITSPVLPVAHMRQFRRWLAAGCHADMEYLAATAPEGRANPRSLLASARSVIVVTAAYGPTTEQDCPPLRAGHGTISRYACRRDYHRVLGKQLRRLCRLMADNWSAETRICVDTAPIFERAWAVQSGAGAVGRNTCLITPASGSWVFLGLILTNLDLSPDPPLPDFLACGDCRRCVEACPTGALDSHRMLDARRCLSYLTIENRGAIPKALRPRLGNRVFGCDACQEVCPHNHAVHETETLMPPRVPQAFDLVELLQMRSEEAFRIRFSGTPVMRAKRRGLLRNACVAAGNSEQPSLRSALVRLLQEEEDCNIREHAQWAIARLSNGADGRDGISDRN